jgi:uncharacterized Zn finger protein (UPF0148 family)
MACPNHDHQENRMNEAEQKPEPKPEQQIAAQPAVLRATISVTRKATGKVETYELIGTPAKQD